MSVKWGRLKNPKRAWLDTLITDMDTWPDNSVKFFKCVLRLMCEMYPINQKGCIIQRLIYYCIQVNWNYISLNGSSNHKILLLYTNLRVYLVVIVNVLKWRGISCLEKGGGLLEFLKEKKTMMAEATTVGLWPSPQLMVPTMAVVGPTVSLWQQGHLGFARALGQQAPRAARGVSHGPRWPDLRLFIRKGANLCAFSCLYPPILSE